MEIVDQLAMFHDAELRQISHLENANRIELKFEKPDGHFAVVSLLGIVAFRVVDFRLQNVVSRLLVHGSNLQLTHAELYERVDWISRTVEGEKLSDVGEVNKLVEKVKSSELSLLILEPSWGAEMIGIAKEISV